MKRAADTILNPALIIRYLLGDSVSESEQTEIELRLFGDDEFLEELQAIELQSTAALAFVLNRTFAQKLRGGSFS
jgi:hypothetical protein